MGEMKARLIIAVVSTILEEAAIVVVVLLGLPQLGVYVPTPALVAIMVAWGVVSITTYRIGTRILLKKPVAGLPDMIGSKGKVVKVIGPEGQVKIKNEIWDIKSLEDKIVVGEEVMVVGQDGLKLIVSKQNPDKT
jgi:membrane-bound ClpP family serine protease